jgi:hypothetical protein
MDIIDMHTKHCLGEAIRADVSIDEHAEVARDASALSFYYSSNQEGFGFPYFIKSYEKIGNSMVPNSFLDLALNAEFGDQYAYTFFQDPMLNESMLHTMLIMHKNPAKKDRMLIIPSFFEAELQFNKQVFNAEQNEVSWMSWQLMVLQAKEIGKKVPSMFQLFVRQLEENKVVDYAYGKLAPMACDRDTLLHN